MGDETLNDLLSGHNEGLRERKKRETRQHISDTATHMFMEKGFDAVKVSDVATACGVSEKTIYNYFPTKESLLLDREDAMAEQIRKGLGAEATRDSPVDAMLDILAENAAGLRAGWETLDDPSQGPSAMRCFTSLIRSTPSLRAAQFDMMNRLAHVAAVAMAERAGINPNDPEPQIAASAILGLCQLQFTALDRYGDDEFTGDELLAKMNADLIRAARLIDSGLWSFGVMMRKRTGGEQLKVAANSAQRATRQVTIALKKARAAWKQTQEKNDAHPRSRKRKA